MDKNEIPKRVVETPSASTSEDDVRSGSFAYVITGIALGFALLLSLMLAGAVAIVLALASSTMEDSGGMGSGYPMTYDDYDDTDFDRWLQQYEDQLQDFGVGTNQTTGEAPVAEVLDYSLSPYQTTIDGELSANAYAGAPSELRDYVRTLVNADKDYTNQVVNLLNQAARNESVRSQKVQEAIDTCAKAGEAIAATEPPANQADEVSGLLTEATGHAKSRWQSMGEELQMLDTQDAVDKERLWQKDDEVIRATDSAADALRDAMEKAANNS